MKTKINPRSLKSAFWRKLETQRFFYRGLPAFAKALRRGRPAFSLDGLRRGEPGLLGSKIHSPDSSFHLSPFTYHRSRPSSRSASSILHSLSSVKERGSHRTLRSQ